MRLLFDLEADGLLEETKDTPAVTTIHCIAAVDVDTGQRYVWGPNEIESALDVLGSASVLIGHNIVRYDLPVIEKLYPTKYPIPHQKRDTLILGRMIHPNVRDTDPDFMPRELRGKHSLEAWGYRLGERKMHFDGPWGVWSQTMMDYMVQDVTTTLRLWEHLGVDEYSQDAVALEHRISNICNSMEEWGVPFDQEAGGKLHAELVGKRDEVEKRLKSQFGYWLAPISPNPQRCVFTPKRDNKKLGYVAGQTFCKMKKVEFSPSSRDNIAKVLIDKGWQPTEFTEGGKPQINEGVVEGVTALFPEFRGLAEYLMLDKRISQLADGEQAWLKVVKSDCRIHGRIDPMGTTTSRASHSSPNLGQVPSIKSPFGRECRALFSVPAGWSLVGADMEGLELRGLAHYLALNDGGAYADVILNGDPHWMHAEAMGLVPVGTNREKGSRLHTIVREDGSKKFIYAYIYGAGDLKVGNILHECLTSARVQCGDEGGALYKEFFGESLRPHEGALRAVGKRIRDDFAKRIDGFAALKAKLDRQVRAKAWVPGLDGRRVPARAQHSALNFLIQSCGAILCKRWGADAIEEMRSKWKLGWNGEIVPVLWVHDEWQVACRKGLEDEVGTILVKNAQAAGQPYGFRVRLDSKYSIGQSWADTH